MNNIQNTQNTQNTQKTLHKENSIKISNKTYFHYELFSVFLENNPKIPLCNRDYINERVNEFYDKIIEYRNINQYDKSIPYFNVLHIAKLDNDFYICDGQHRYYAYKKYFDNQESDFYISYVVKYCINKDELKQYFRDLNNIFILHEILLKDDEIDILERIKTYLKNKYPKHLSQSLVPRYPNVNIDQLVKYLINTYPKLDYQSLINKLEQLNENIGNDLIVSNHEYYEVAQKKQGFFISYLFIKTESENKRKSIPKTVRDNLWNKKFGEELNGHCYVCNCKITYHNFHAGHKTSVKNGGSNNINNLEIVCPACNLSMGIQDMELFKNKYF